MFSALPPWYLVEAKAWCPDEGVNPVSPERKPLALVGEVVLRTALIVRCGSVGRPELREQGRARWGSRRVYSPSVAGGALSRALSLGVHCVAGLARARICACASCRGGGLRGVRRPVGCGRLDPGDDLSRGVPGRLHAD